MKSAPFVAMILGGLILLWPSGGDGPAPGPDPSDMVSQAFDTYERLWRAHNATAAGKLRSGEITSDTEIHQFISAGQDPMRRIAFEPIAKAEQEALAGGWTPEKHAQILEGYSR